MSEQKAEYRVDEPDFPVITTKLLHDEKELRDALARQNLVQFSNEWGPEWTTKLTTDGDGGEMLVPEGLETVNIPANRESIIKHKIIYIAGGMRGIRHFNFPAFDAARDNLKAEGWNVISPADLDRETGFDETAFPDDYDWVDLDKIGFNLHDAVDRDVEALKKCDAIYMLVGWEKSKGATAEKALAEWLGLQVIYQDEVEAFVKAESECLPHWRYFPELTKCMLDAEKQSVRDGDTVTNEAGGKQSFMSARFDCIPPETLRLLAQCLGFGARRYGKDNWQSIELSDHLAHAMNHINEWRMDDRSEPHLVNAMARITFALSMAVREGLQPSEYVHPDDIK